MLKLTSTRKVLLVAALTVVPLLLGTAPSGPPPSAAAPAPRPNIVVITTDDMRVSDLEAMPRTRSRLAAAGTTFANSYATFPLCCPSRATMLTGQYAHNHGVLGNGYPVGGYGDFDPSSTVATWLQAAGYRTAMVGKFVNEFGAVKPVTVPPGWLDFNANVGGGNYFATRIFQNGRAQQYDGPYQADLHTDISVGVLQRHLPSDAPLFLWTSYYGPHLGQPREADDPTTLGTPAVAPRHRNAFAGRPLPTDPSFNEADMSDKPLPLRNRAPLSAGIRAQITESYQQRLEALLAVDEGVARLLDTIQAAGELDDTVVLFTSDNGWILGEHRIHAGKTVVYEPSSRVPLLARGPGFPAGATRSQLVGNVDLAPTFVDLAETTAGLPQDGTSLLPIAASPTGGPVRDLLLEAGPRQEGDPMYYTAIRTDRWLYVEYPKNNARELYDMAADPYQLDNLASRPAHAEVRRQLAQDLAALRTCVGEACR